MPHRYTCHDCDTTGAVHPTERAAYKDQDDHRRTVHGGMSPPAGDRVGYAPPSHRGLLIWVAVFAALVLIKRVTGIAPDDVARWLGLL